MSRTSALYFCKKTKKITAYIIAFFMIAGLLPATLSLADNSADYSDYVPCTPYNMYGSGTGANWIRNSSMVDVTGQATSATVLNVIANSTYTLDSYKSVDGVTIPKSNFSSDWAFVLKPSTTYVMSVKVRNANKGGVDKAPVFNYGIGRPGATGYTLFADSAEGYGAKEISGSEWTEFQNIQITPFNHESANIQMGLAKSAGNIIGNGVEVDKSTMFFAEEAAHDIKVVNSRSEVTVGDSLSADVSVLNQLGATGNLTQGTFKWYAMDSRRTNILQGFTITPSADTSSVNITVGMGVSPGTYSIVCVSDLYDGFVKGFELKVRSISDDYIPGVPANYYGAGTLTAWTRNSTLVDVTGQSIGAKIATIIANGTYGDSNYYNVDGAVITKANFSDESNSSLKPNTTYVISANVRNISTNTQTPPIFKIGIGKDTYGTSFYTNGHLGSGGMAVTSAQWMEFKDYVTTADTHSGINIQAGLLKKAGNVVGNGVEIDKETLFIAEEMPYDIVLTSDKSLIKKGKNTFTVNAEIVNQIYLKGNVNQGQFFWYALNGTRDAICDDITITPTQDTRSAEVTVGENVPVGTYFVVASSETYQGFSKGYRITVYEDEPHLKLYVSPGGNDDKRSGHIDSPLKTLDFAKQIIREVPHKEQFAKIEVIFRGGDYYMDTATLTQADSGAENVPIEYKAYNGEHVNFKGSVLLDPQSAQKVTNPSVLSRFYPQVRDKIMVIDLESQGVTQNDIFNPEVNGLYSIEADKGSDYNCIYIDGKETLIAQWPNGNHRYANWTTKVDSQSFCYDDKEPDRWTDVSGAWLDCFPEYDFSKARISLKSIDTQNKIISVTDNPVESFTSTASKRWKVYNIIEEIDLPGEFYIDRENMLLYIYPTEDFENSKLEISVVSDSLVKVTDASHITFEGINFSQSRGRAVSLRDVDNINITKCNFSDISAIAVSGIGSVTAKTGENYWQFQKKNGVNNSRISGCTFRNIGASAINLTGGDIDTLTSANTVIEDNYITDCNNRYIINSALMIGGCGVEIRNNNISKSGQHAIHMRGCNFIVENNEIHDVMLDVGDAGAIYIGRNQIYRGTQIRNNYIHDLNPHDKRITNATVGIYVDDTQSGIDVYNNIVYNARLGYNSNGGNSGKVYNNIFVDCGRSWYFRDHNSIGYLPTADYSVMGTVDDAVNSIYDKDLYFDKFPALKEWAETKGNLKKWSVINDNLSVNSGNEPVMGNQEQLYSDIGAKRTEASLSGLDVSVQQGSNLVLNSSDFFSDPQNQDFRVVKGSPIAELMPDLPNTDYDIESIGMQNDLVFGGEKSEFSLIYPFDNRTIYRGESIELYWQESFGATKYNVTVARDIDFKDTVCTKTVYTNVTSIDGIDKDGTYFWKVEAVNNSREMKASWQSSNIMSFEVSAFAYPKVSISVQGSTVNVDAVIVNGVFETAPDAHIYVALYDEHGNLIGTSTQTKTLPKDTRCDVNAVFTDVTTPVKSYSIFIWDKTIKPYTIKKQIYR